MLNIVDVGSEAALEVGDHALLHFVGREAGVLEDDADDGDVYIRENIHRHGDDGGAAQDGDEQGHDDESVGAAKGQPDNPHSVCFRGGERSAHNLL